MSIKALIWDLEGVLLISDLGSVEQIIQKRLNVTAEAIGEFFHSELNDVVDRGEMTQEEYWLHLLEKLNLPKQQLSLINQYFYNDLYIDQELLNQIKLYKNHYKTALLTNYSEVLRPLLNTQWCVDSAFDEILISCEVKMVKPDPRIFDLVLNRLNIRKDEAIFIDDREKNIIGAQEYGLKSILFETKDQTITELENILYNFS